MHLQPLNQRNYSAFKCLLQGTKHEKEKISEKLGAIVTSAIPETEATTTKELYSACIVFFLKLVCSTDEHSLDWNVIYQTDSKCIFVLSAAVDSWPEGNLHGGFRFSPGRWNHVVD